VPSRRLRREARLKRTRRRSHAPPRACLAFVALPWQSPAFAGALRPRWGRPALLRALAELAQAASNGLRFRRTRLAASGRRMNLAFVLFGRGSTLAAARFQTASLGFPILPGHDFGESGLDHSDLRQWCARNARALDANHEYDGPRAGPNAPAKIGLGPLPKWSPRHGNQGGRIETTPGSRNYSRGPRANADRLTARGSALSLRHWREPRASGRGSARRSRRATISAAVTSAAR
jgi:hypothetical protein